MQVWDKIEKGTWQKDSADAVSAEHCYNENEDCGEAVAQQITVKHQKTSEDQETNEDDVTDQDARKFITGLCL
jgi:hypothetical protein